MIEEPFAVGNSVIHSIDPRFKLVFATLISFIIALSNEFQPLYLGLFFSVLLIIFSRINLFKIVKKLSVVAGFLLLLWIVLPVTYKGDIFFYLWSLGFSKQGIVLCSKITLKSVSILFIFISLVATMTFAAMGQAMDKLGVPGKIVHLFLMTFRYVFVLDFEYKRLLKAVKIRGFKAKNGMHTYKTYAYIIGMLFVRAAQRGERVHQAMLCRGFKGRFYSLHEFLPHVRDWIFSVFMVVLLTILLLLEYGFVHK